MEGDDGGVIVAPLSTNKRQKKKRIAKNKKSSCKINTRQAKNSFLFIVLA